MSFFKICLRTDFSGFDPNKHANHSAGSPVTSAPAGHSHRWPTFTTAVHSCDCATPQTTKGLRCAAPIVPLALNGYFSFFCVITPSCSPGGRKNSALCDAECEPSPDFRPYKQLLHGFDHSRRFHTLARSTIALQPREGRRAGLAGFHPSTRRNSGLRGDRVSKGYFRSQNASKTSCGLPGKSFGVLSFGRWAEAHNRSKSRLGPRHNRLCVGEEALPAAIFGWSFSLRKQFCSIRLRYSRIGGGGCTLADSVLVFSCHMRP